MQLSERKLNGFWKPAAAVMLTLALLFGTGMSKRKTTMPNWRN